MKKTITKSIVVSLKTAFLLIACSWQQNVNAQFCGYEPGNGCPNTDYNNAFLQSTNNAATIEYDNFVSTFHSTMVRTSSGDFKVWGEKMANNGTSSVLSPQDLNNVNYPALGSAKVLKVTGGSAAPDAWFAQFIALATDGLYAWGQAGRVIHSNITSGNTFQKITVNGKADGLPPGVSPADVKMMTAEGTSNSPYGDWNGALVIVTCEGAVWVLSHNTVHRGNGATGSAMEWSRVQTSAGVYLTDVVAARVAANQIMALKSDGTLWTWGVRVYLADGNSPINYSTDWATQMVSPPGTPKMIGLSSGTYYALMTDGNLYAVGGNYTNGIGNWVGSMEVLTWTQPRYNSASGQVMNNIAWISPQENDGSGFGSHINVLTTDGVVYQWGYSMEANPATYNHPHIPGGLTTSDKMIALKTGGHSVMVIKECSTNFGYFGHRVNGSMGNGSADDVHEPSFTFNTAPVEICGAAVSPKVQDLEVCTGSTVDLNTASLEAPGSVEWFTNQAGTIPVSNVTAVGPGTYYAFFTASGCTAYSVVTVTASGACPVQIQGTVFNDANSNTIIDGTETGTNTGNNLYVYLVDANGIISAVSPVASNGTYSIEAAQNNTYTLHLSTEQYAIGTNTGTTPINTNPPAGWATTGENGSGNNTGSGDGTADGVLQVVVGSTDVTNQNFGIQEQCPGTELAPVIN